ncbi:unnamed protein product [Camellia sinensis]
MSVYEGVIDDPYGELFIAENKSLPKESLTQDYDAKCWRERYSLKEDIPSFLENAAGTILTIGKYLNVSVSENSKLMSSGSNHHYLECIKAAYEFASVWPNGKIAGVCAVLEPNWHVMHNRLQTAKSIDDVIEYHNFFFEKCLRECLLLLSEVLKDSPCRIGEESWEHRSYCCHTIINKTQCQH